MHSLRISFFLGLFLSLGTLSTLAGQDFPRIPPVPSPAPLAGSPGEHAYQELKNHLDYFFQAENQDLLDSVAIPDPAAVEWQGMNRFEVLDVVRALALAQVVLEYGVLDPADKAVPIWIRDVRGYKKPNGWYGLRINGKIIDESSIWFAYAGAQLNLRAFCTTGSRMLDPQLQFQR